MVGADHLRIISEVIHRHHHLEGGSQGQWWTHMEDLLIPMLIVDIVELITTHTYSTIMIDMSGTSMIVLGTRLLMTGTMADHSMIAIDIRLLMAGMPHRYLTGTVEHIGLLTIMVKCLGWQLPIALL